MFVFEDQQHLLDQLHAELQQAERDSTDAKKPKKEQQLAKGVAYGIRMCLDYLGDYFKGVPEAKEVE